MDIESKPVNVCSAIGCDEPAGVGLVTGMDDVVRWLCNDHLPNTLRSLADMTERIVEASRRPLRDLS